MIDAESIKKQFLLSEVAGRYTALKKHGKEFAGLCPFHLEKTPSFTVNDAKQVFYCYGCGASGNVIHFIQRAENKDFKSAIEFLTGGNYTRIDDARRERMTRRAETDDAKKDDFARQMMKDILRQSRPAGGTLVETYLRARGVLIADVGGFPRGFFFHPNLRYDRTQSFPAMVAVVQDVHGRCIGLHRTYLRFSGLDKANVPSAKKMLGNIRGGSVRLTDATTCLAVCEGIETGLSVLRGYRSGNTPIGVWSALSLGNMATIELPSSVERVVICGDNDTKDPAANELSLQNAARRFRLQGRRANIVLPPRGMDFNDLLRAGVA